MEIGCPDVNPWDIFFFRGSIFQAELILPCCGLDTLNSTFLDFGALELNQVVSLAQPGEVRLPTHLAKRAQILFNVSGSGLFSQEKFGYGVLFRTVFRFQESLVEQNDATIRSQIMTKFRSPARTDYLNKLYTKDREDRIIYEYFFIGLHLRHSEIHDQKNLDTAQDISEMPCLYSQLEQAMVSMGITDNKVPLSAFIRSNGTSTLPLGTNRNLDGSQKGKGFRFVVFVASDRPDALNKVAVKLEEDSTMKSILLKMRLRYEHVQIRAITTNHTKRYPIMISVRFFIYFIIVIISSLIFHYVNLARTWAVFRTDSHG